MVHKDDIRVTKRGAFKAGGALDPASKLAESLQKLFKLDLVQDEKTGVKTVKVTSEDGKWTSEVPWSKDLANFFGGQTKKYVVGIAHPEHGLKIISGITNQDW